MRALATGMHTLAQMVAIDCAESGRCLRIAIQYYTELGKLSMAARNIKVRLRRHGWHFCGSRLPDPHSTFLFCNW